MEELRRKAYRRRLFNEQAAKLVARTPSLRDEVAWRVDHLNAKWELVEQIMAPAQPASEHQDVFTGNTFFHTNRLLLILRFYTEKNVGRNLPIFIMLSTKLEIGSEVFKK